MVDVSVVSAVAVVLSTLSLAMTATLVRSLRRSNSSLRIERLALFRVVGELLRRGSAFLDCDRCGGRLDLDVFLVGHGDEVSVPSADDATRRRGARAI